MIWLFLIFLAASPVWAAMQFDGSTEWAEINTAPLTAAPFTMCCLFRPERDTANETLLGISLESAGLTDMFLLQARGASPAGDPIGAAIGTTSSGTSVQAVSSTGFTVNTWHSACGVWSATNARDAYIDGGSKGSETTEMGNPTSPGTISMGMWASNNTEVQQFDGAVAECGIWSATLSDREIESLATHAPPCVRRMSLIEYYPTVRDVTTVKEIFGTENPLATGPTLNLTLTGGTVFSHPNVVNCQ